MIPTTQTESTGIEPAPDLAILITAGDSAVIHVPLLRVLLLGNGCRHEGPVPADADSRG